MTEIQSEKQVATYGCGGSCVAEGHGAILRDVEHPKLGHMNCVRTSRVLRVEEDGTIETVNTIYKRVEQ